MGSLISSALIQGYAWWRAPRYSANYSVNPLCPTTADLVGNVRIVRDRFGVAHIYAHSRNDLYFGQGFVTAQERLVAWEIMRRVARGTLSEIRPEALPLDRLCRTLGFARLVRNDIPSLNPAAFSRIHAFVNGMNHFLESSAYVAPPEVFFGGLPKPERVTEEDVALVIRFVGFQLSRNWMTKLVGKALLDVVEEHQRQRELGGDQLPDSATSDVFDEVLKGLVLGKGESKLSLSNVEKLLRLHEENLSSFGGSNVLVVGPQHTETGYPILESDPHLRVASPSVWIRFRLVCPEENINATGFTMVGGYGVHMGHNEFCAWGPTVSYADIVDVYEHKIRELPGGERHEVLVNESEDEWRELLVIEESIRVKGRDEPFIERCRITPNCGPIISDVLRFAEEPDEEDRAREAVWNEISIKGLSFEPRVEGYEDERMMDEMYRVGSWQEFRDCVSSVALLSFNFAYADVEGNIGLILSGALPKRSEDALRRVGEIMPGWDPAYHWLGFQPTQPTTFNPPSGVIVNCNSDSFSEDSPYYISVAFRPPIRYGRILQLVEEIISREEEEEGEAGAFTVEDAMRIPKDVTHMHVGLVTRFAQYACDEESITNGSFRDRCIAHAAVILKYFDGVFTIDSVGASIYASFLTALLHVLLENAGVLDPKLVEHLAGFGFSHKFFCKTSYTCFRELIVDRLFEAETDAGIRKRIVRRSLEMGLTYLRESVDESVYASFEADNDAEGYVNSFRWGVCHRLIWEYPLADKVASYQAEVPCGGCLDSPCLAAYPTDGTHFNVVEYPSARMVVDLADVHSAVCGIFPGNSGHWGSPFFHDGVELWKSGGYREMYFRDEEVERNTHGEILFNVVS